MKGGCKARGETSEWVLTIEVSKGHRGIQDMRRGST